MKTNSLHPAPDQRQNDADRECVCEDGLHLGGLLLKLGPDQSPIGRPQMEPSNNAAGFALNSHAQFSSDARTFTARGAKGADRRSAPESKISLFRSWKAIQVCEKFFHARTLPKGIGKVNTRGLCTQTAAGRLNTEMDKFEFRRLAFKQLVDSQGPTGQAVVSKKTGLSESYVSRMLYPPGKDGAKRIGEKSVDLLTQHYPGWLDVDLKAVGENVFTSRRSSDRERMIQNVIALLRETDSEGIDIVLHSATLMAKKYPISKQTAQIVSMTDWRKCMISARSELFTE